MASMNGHAMVVEQLLAAGADTQARDAVRSGDGVVKCGWKG